MMRGTVYVIVGELVGRFVFSAGDTELEFKAAAMRQWARLGNTVKFGPIGPSWKDARHG